MSELELTRIRADVRKLEGKIEHREAVVRGLEDRLGELAQRSTLEHAQRVKLHSRLEHVERAAAGLLEHAERLRFVVSQHERRLDDLRPEAPPAPAGGVQ